MPTVSDTDPGRVTTFVRATAAAHRDVKRLREAARKADGSFARLEEATYGLFGIKIERSKS